MKRVAHDFLKAMPRGDWRVGKEKEQEKNHRNRNMAPPLERRRGGDAQSPVTMGNRMGAEGLERASDRYIGEQKRENTRI